MDQPQRAIGILGGTFDPIHIGHLRMALESYEVLGLAKVHLVPCYEPVHRSLPAASPEDRLAMTVCAADNEPSLYADAREIQRKGPSYTIDTLEEIRQEMPNTPLCLLIGIDALIGFPTWHRFMEILDFAHLIVAYRPSFQMPTTGVLADIVKSRLQHEKAYIHANLAGGILTLPMTALEISASEIRKQIAMGRNPRYLLPDSVYEYIQQHGIYHK
jgi:nicotinate-nucleotide adenylyltransferase